MTSLTRREFISWGIAGTTALGLVTTENDTTIAAGTPAAASLRSQPIQSVTQAKKLSELIVTGKAIRQGFGGVGFHAQMFLETCTQDFFDQVLAKRWRELNPRFARIFHSWTEGQPGKRDSRVLDALARQMVFMKEASETEIYLTTSDLKDILSQHELRAYAAAVADDLEYLLNCGATNLKYYCCTNELSLDQWADMHDDLPRFRTYHAAIADEIKRRKLGIKLLATDASPTEYWNTIEWAARNMDDISGVYGGHHYINEHAPDNLEFYKWFRERCRWAVGLAKGKAKDFILGEFGPAQYFDSKYGLRWDTCKYFGTPLEGLAGLQLAEAALAAINAGVYAMGYWTFTDYPDRPTESSINHWGVFKWATNGAETRAPYYAYGLLTKFFRGPATVFEVESGDELLRVAALQHDENKTWSIAVLNREPLAMQIAVRIELMREPVVFRKYVYDPRHVPVTEDGDLQEPEGKVRVADSRLVDSVEAGTLTIYTTAFDESAPDPVKELEVTRIHDTRSPGQTAEANRLRWKGSPRADTCYYRIYHGGIRVGSTVAMEFMDTGPTQGQQGPYSVVAVNRSGNASR